MPFFLVRKQLSTLVKNLEIEQERQKDEIVQKKLNNEVFIEKLKEYMSEHGLDKDKASQLIEYICENSMTDANSARIYDFSVSQISRIISQVYEKEEFDANDIIKATKGISNSLIKTKKYRDKMLTSSIEGYEEFSKKKEEFEREIIYLTVEREKQNQELLVVEDEFAKLQNLYFKSRENYEKLLKSKSISELSERAMATYTLLEEKLIRRQSEILQKEFIKCFSSIINKENFLDGIVIDNSINIIPYKLVDVSFLQIDNYIKAHAKSNWLDLFDKKYLIDINNLRLGYEESIKLPSPIVAPFSQGERQVYIMSIYLALLKTSKKGIPFFIDTPFARIDSKHREKIISEFFMGVSNQMFILSTDEEIVGVYKKQIETDISDKFLLNIDNYGKTTIIKDMYFGE